MTEKKPCKFCRGTGFKHPDNDGTQFNCFDCKKSHAEYMVDNRTWLDAMPDYAQKKQELKAKFGNTDEAFRIHIGLCLLCLEARLKRPLRPEDFTDAAINDGIRLGGAMARRREDKAQ